MDEGAWWAVYGVAQSGTSGVAGALLLAGIPDITIWGTKVPSPRAWRPDFPGAAREAP